MNMVVRDIQPQADQAVDFRSAMRALTGGVSIITVGRGDDITGMTVTSVASLSVDPPTLLVSVNRSSSSWLHLKRHRAFAVNILSANQREIAERFAGGNGLKGAERFRGNEEWTAGVTGSPLLTGSLASIDCEVEDIIERHSHAIIIGGVKGVRTATGQNALAYFDGHYVDVDVEGERPVNFGHSRPLPRVLR